MSQSRRWLGAAAVLLAIQLLSPTQRAIADPLPSHANEPTGDATTESSGHPLLVRYWALFPSAPGAARQTDGPPAETAGASPWEIQRTVADHALRRFLVQAFRATRVPGIQSLSNRLARLPRLSRRELPDHIVGHVMGVAQLTLCPDMGVCAAPLGTAEFQEACYRWDFEDTRSPLGSRCSRALGAVSAVGTADALLRAQHALEGLEHFERFLEDVQQAGVPPRELARLSAALRRDLARLRSTETDSSPPSAYRQWIAATLRTSSPWLNDAPAQGSLVRDGNHHGLGAEGCALCCLVDHLAIPRLRSATFGRGARRLAQRPETGPTTELRAILLRVAEIVQGQAEQWDDERSYSMEEAVGAPDPHAAPFYRLARALRATADAVTTAESWHVAVAAGHFRPTTEEANNLIACIEGDQPTCERSGGPSSSESALTQYTVCNGPNQAFW